MSWNNENFKVIEERYPLLHLDNEELSYGTSGFRAKGYLLPPVAARLILVAVLRGICVWNQKKEEKKKYAADSPYYCNENCANFPNGSDNLCCNMGLMITASHNPCEDNGFKIIDYNGQSIPENWEYWCTTAVNTHSAENYGSVLRKCQKMMIQNDVGIHDGSSHVHVFIGTDTRPSGRDICAAAVHILTLVGVNHTVLENVSTPQLHEVVLQGNCLNTFRVPLDYYEKKIVQSFKTLFTSETNCTKENSHSDTRNNLESKKVCLVIDAANGVGTMVLQRLCEQYESFFNMYFDIKLVNTDVQNAESLNNGCGADYVNRHQGPSTETEKLLCEIRHGLEKYSDVHFYAFDGDADRLVALDYFNNEKEEPTWILMDGDRFSSLFALLLSKLLGPEIVSKLDVGVVQTAYANGASTLFVEQTLKIKTHLAATGVKNIHPVAQSCDIGIYFEANGHGTILFKHEKITAALSSTSPSVCASTSKAALLQIVEISRLLSQVCGDAIADLLMCEVALKHLNMNFSDMRLLYTDFPSIQVKLEVPFPKRITTVYDGTRALTPAGMQDQIDKAVEDTKQEIIRTNHCNSNEKNECPYARSFVRASGTENLVRVYCETSSKASCKSLADKVCGIVRTFCT